MPNVPDKALARLTYRRHREQTLPLTHGVLGEDEERVADEIAALLASDLNAV